MSEGLVDALYTHSNVGGMISSSMNQKIYSKFDLRLTFGAWSVLS